jgi:hypothetical protein
MTGLGEAPHVCLSMAGLGGVPKVDVSISGLSGPKPPTAEFGMAGLGGKQKVVLACWLGLCPKSWF